MPMTQFEVRPARAGDARAMAELFAAVAEERTGIATEPPVDVSERAALFAGSAGESMVAVAEGQLIGMLHIEVSRHGFGELGMLVDRGWRGAGWCCRPCRPAHCPPTHATPRPGAGSTVGRGTLSHRFGVGAED